MTPAPASVVHRVEPRLSAPAFRSSQQRAPLRGLVRRLRYTECGGGFEGLARANHLTPAFSAALGHALEAEGPAPWGMQRLSGALDQVVRFEPLRADALRPLLFFGAETAQRAAIVASAARSMREAGRTLRLLSVDGEPAQSEILLDAGMEMGCGVWRFRNIGECLEALRDGDPADSVLVMGGRAAPEAALVRAIGAEPVAILGGSAPQALLDDESQRLRRVVLAPDASGDLGPALGGVYRCNLAIMGFFVTIDGEKAYQIASPDGLAEMFFTSG